MGSSETQMEPQDQEIQAPPLAALVPAITKNLTLPEVLIWLSNERNFYSRIASSLKQTIVPGMGTMAVGISGGRLCLYYDPAFLGQLSLSAAIWVLEHEMYHLAMDHIPRYLEQLASFIDPLQRERAKHVNNIAADAAVNTNIRKSNHFARAVTELRDVFHAAHIKALPEGAEPPPKTDKTGIILPENFDMGLDESYETYLALLMPQVRFIVQAGQGNGSHVSEELMKRILEDSNTIVDKSHANWGDKKEPGENGGYKSQGPQESTGKGKGRGKNKDGEGGKKPADGPPKGYENYRTPEELRALAERIRTQEKQLLRQAVREQQRDQGTIPGDLAEFFDSFLSDPIIPWWEVLTSRIKTTQQYKASRGLQRPNRALTAMAEEDVRIIPALGKLKDPKFRVFFMTDTSGSMSSESLAIACSELSFLLQADEDIQVRWIQGDCSIHFDRLYTAGEQLSGHIYGRGGTDFDVYFQYMGKYMNNEEVAPDLVIVYTDGYASAVKPENQLSSAIPVIWLLSAEGAEAEIKSGNYGEVIHCEKSHNVLRDKE